MEAKTETKFGTKVAWGEDDAVEYTHSTEKAHDTALDDEKYDMHYSEGRPIGKNMSDGT